MLEQPRELFADRPGALRVARYYAEAGELAQSIASSREALEPLAPDLAKHVESFEGAVLRLLECTAVDSPGTSPEGGARAIEQVQQRYRDLKNTLLQAGAEGAVPVGDLVAHLDRLSNVRRLAEQMERGARHLWALAAFAEQGEEPPDLAAASANGEARIESPPPDPGRLGP